MCSSDLEVAEFPQYPVARDYDAMRVEFTRAAERIQAQAEIR